MDTQKANAHDAQAVLIYCQLRLSGVFRPLSRPASSRRQRILYLNTCTFGVICQSITQPSLRFFGLKMALLLLTT